jgi:hypothetical protein
VSELWTLQFDCHSGPWKNQLSMACGLKAIGKGERVSHFLLGVGSHSAKICNGNSVNSVRLGHFGSLAFTMTCFLFTLEV